MMFGVCFSSNIYEDVIAPFPQLLSSLLVRFRPVRMMLLLSFFVDAVVFVVVDVYGVVIDLVVVVGLLYYLHNPVSRQI